MLEFNVFSDTVYTFLDNYVEAFLKQIFIADDTLLDSFKLKAYNDLIDTQYNEPKELVDTYFEVLTTDSKLPTERADEINKLSSEDFKNSITKLITTMRAKLLLVGDVVEEKIEQIHNKLTENFKGKTSSAEGSTYKIKDRQSLVYYDTNKVDSKKNSAIANYYRVNIDTRKNAFVTQIVVKFIGGIYFNELRTIKKLGYFVRSNYHEIQGDSYIVLQLMGSVNLKNKESNPKLFNDEFDKITGQLKEKVFNDPDATLLTKYKESLINSLVSSPLTLADKVNSIWGEFDFKNEGRRLEESDDVKLINSITSVEVKKMFNDIFYDEVRKLSVRIYAKDTTPEEKNGNYALNGEIVETVTQDKSILKTKSTNKKT